MCECTVRAGLDRRRFLTAGTAAAAAAILLPRPAAAFALSPVEVEPGLSIVPRSDWGGDLPPLGPLEAEAPGDARFLLVHHSASTNDYQTDQTVAFLRDFYELHTVDKGWPDVAYNFFVDRFGQVFEARTGSLDRPVKGDATGGSQGFAQLCCFVGDHTVELPTLAATTSMIKLLAWLAATYQIDTAPGATTTFTSRGSNLHPAGSVVTAATISGHRDMSQTACPGDALYPVVRQEFPAAVTRRRQEVTEATTTTPPPATTEPPSTPTTAVTASATEPSTPPITAPPADSAPSDSLPWALGAAGLTAAAGGAVVLRRRGRSNEAARIQDPD